MGTSIIPVRPTQSAEREASPPAADRGNRAGYSPLKRRTARGAAFCCVSDVLATLCEPIKIAGELTGSSPK